MFFMGGSWQASSWLGLACFCYSCAYLFIYFKILILCFNIYILVIGNIMNKFLFMKVEIAENLLLFGETITILFV